MRIEERIADLAARAGIGLAAGLVGTAAMTASSTIEAKLRGRGGSSAPADAAGKVLGVEPSGEPGRQRFAQIVHWLYGTGLGAARGVLDGLGLPPAAATVAHAALIWGSEQVALPALGAMEPVYKQPPAEIGIDLIHQAVYAGTTGAVYTRLIRRVD